MQKLVILSFAFVLMAFMSATGAFGAEKNREPWLPDQNESRVDAGKKPLNAGKPSFPAVELFQGGDHHLSFSYNSFNVETLRPEGAIIFNGQTFAVDDPDLDYDVYDFVYQYDVLDLGDLFSGLSLGVVGQMKMMGGKARLLSPAPKNRDEFNAPIPMVGLNLKMDILGDFLKGRVRATGMGYSRGDVFDSQAELSITPFPYLDIHGGYRYFFIDIETDDVELNYGTSGPYMGISLSF